MEAAQQQQQQQQAAAPIPASIENANEWDAYARELSADTGLPTQLTPELVANVIGGAVPLLFAADASPGDMSSLRGTFSDQVIVQCRRNHGDLSGARPTSVSAQMTGTPHVDGHAVLRMHLTIRVVDSAGREGVTRHFWDLQLNTQAIVGQAECPNCGAPVPKGELICEHCQADVRQLVATPLIVSRLELY